MGTSTDPRPEGLMKGPIWVESNEEKEAARSLEMLHVQLISTVIDPYCWKWVIVALHHTLQTFVLAGLYPPEETRTLEPMPARETLKVHYGAADRYPEP